MISCMLVGDVSIVVNTAPSALRHKDPAEHRAQEKRKKHEANVKARNAEFFPLVLETSGAIHHDFDKFITAIASRLDKGMQRPFRKQMLFVVSDALMRGCARTVTEKFHLMWTRQDSTCANYCG